MGLLNKIDVVIPIYNAYTVLVGCLKSLESNQDGINQVILINDASTDSRVSSLLKKYDLLGNWNIINHRQNKGFVVSANEGLNYSNNHTVLLNSDTIVSKNWIRAFRKSIKQNKKLGTATAWSNNAEICSFPEFLTFNKKPKEINILSEILYKNYDPKYPVIPTAVGFCMLITKKAKKQVGYFDENHFGHGYGEENDYSLRVEKAGLINILCDNAYVIHVGNESFRDLGLKPNEVTMKRLLEKHPSYSETISNYIKNDPLAPVRIGILDVIKRNNSQLYDELISDD